jgi:Zn-dependent protease
MGDLMHVLAWLFPFFQGLMLGVIAMAFHEAGHLIAAPLVGIKIKTIGLKWKGLYTVREAGPPAKNLIVSVAGPLTNMALLLFWPLSHRFGLANLCFLFFNILPIEGSDGERIWTCWRAIKRERRSNSASNLYAAYGTAKDTIIPSAGLEVLASEPSRGED